MSEFRLFKNGQEIIFPRGSSRKIKTSIKPLESGSVERDVYGNAIWMGDPAFWRNRISVSCSDQTPPPISGNWRGQHFTLHSPKFESVPGPNATLITDAVPGSIFGVDRNDNFVAAGVADEDRNVSIPGSVSIRYRPIFECILIDRSGDGTENDASEGWSLEFEELAGGEEDLIGGGNEDNTVWAIATGGEEVDFKESGKNKRILKFHSSQNITFTKAGFVEIEAASGSSGGGFGPYGGGGGASTPVRLKIWVEVGTYPIIVGAGGPGGPNSSTNGLPGNQTSGLGVFALISGRGGSRSVNGGKDGASGGGASLFNSSNNSSVVGGSATAPSQGLMGFKGGDCPVNSAGAGGGGAGGPGGEPDKQDGITLFGGNGGIGIVSNFADFERTICAGGGGGGRIATHGIGGSSIGGNGGEYQGSKKATDGSPNTGSGGGGAGDAVPGGKGGSGWFYVKFGV